MANLFLIGKNRIKNLLPTPFRSEEEFEKTVFHTKDLLEDIFLLKRQVRGGKKPGIPDIIGVDGDSNVCIIELKNTSVDSSVLPQILQYALWAESNPDSIKALWLEAGSPEEISMSFDKYDVRVVVIAPSIDPSILEVIGKLNYQVDLVEIKRWIAGSDQFLLVNRLERPATPRIRPIKGLQAYDRKAYEAYFNKQSVMHFMRYAHQIKSLVKGKGWPLELKFNKYYCAFKHGFFIVFGIKWISSKSFSLFFKVPEGTARRLAPKASPMTKYDAQWKEAVFLVEPGKTRIAQFGRLFETAFKGITGES